jgi:hypothetical protein
MLAFIYAGIESMRKKTIPLCIILLALFVSLLAASQLYRIVLAFNQWNFLHGLIEISPYYIVISSLFWSCVFFYLVLMTLRGRKQVPVLAMVCFVSFVLYKWIDLLWISSATVENWLFLLVSEIIILMSLVLIFSRKTVKAFYGDNHEHKPKNSKAA